MVLSLLKWLNEICFDEINKETLIKLEVPTKGKFILRRKEEFMDFQIKEKLIL